MHKKMNKEHDKILIENDEIQDLLKGYNKL